MIPLLFLAIFLGGVLLIATYQSRKHPLLTQDRAEEAMAEIVIEQVLQQGVNRRNSNWAPAMSRHVRRQYKNVREQHYMNWDKLKFGCEQSGLDYNIVVKHVKRLAKKYKITIG